MARLGTLILGVVVAFSCVSSSAQAATLGRIFALQFNTLSGPDFLGLGALPKNLELLAVMDDGGLFTDLRLFNGSIAGGAPQIGTPFDLTTSFWTIGNGATDTFTMQAFAPVGRVLNFTIDNLPSSVANNTQNVANADAILRQPAVLGSAFSLFAFGQGYQGTVQAVPEPGTMALLIGAVTGIGYYRRRKAKQAS